MTKLYWIGYKIRAQLDLVGVKEIEILANEVLITEKEKRSLV